MRYAHSILLILTLTLTERLMAQGAGPAQPPADRLQQANSFFSHGEWKAALEAYRALSADFPAHPLSRFRIGVSQLELGQLAEAEKNLREGERLGIPAAQAGFRLAQLKAEQRRPEEAMAELARAVNAGLFVPPSSLTSDRHLVTLKSHPRWPGVLDTLDATLRPCLHDPRFREFDFWVGDWDVRPTGQPPTGPPSRNVITIEDNGCVVMEHWNAPSGSEGQSFNIFDRAIGKWRQTWVDNQGGQHDYRGGLRNGDMAFVGETPPPNGTLGHIPTRLTFFRLGPDSVRQFSETSADSGRTWQVSYDLTYVRRPGSIGAREALAGRVVGESGTLRETDRRAIRKLDSAFVDGWIRDDTLAVLAVFSPDAVLLPPGALPVSGLPAIRAYWWPADGSHTRIRSFDRSIAEIGGSRQLAYIRGTGSLRWEYTRDGKTTTNTTRSTDLILLAADALGNWRVVRQMWSALP